MLVLEKHDISFIYPEDSKFNVIACSESREKLWDLALREMSSEVDLIEDFGQRLEDFCQIEEGEYISTSEVGEWGLMFKISEVKDLDKKSKEEQI